VGTTAPPVATDAWAAERQQLQRDLDAARQEAARTAADSAAALRRLGDTHAEATERLRRDLGAAQQETAQARTSSSALSESVRRLQVALEKQKAELRDALAKEDALEGALERERQKAEESSALARELRHVLDSSAQSQFDTNSSLEDLRRAKEGLQLRCAQQQDALGASAGRIAQLEGQLQACHGRIAELEHSLDTSQAGSADLIDDLRERERSTMASLSAAEAKLASALQDATDVTVLRSDLAIRDAELSSATASLSALQAALEAFQQQKAAAEETWMAKVEALERSVGQLQQEKQRLDARVAVSSVPPSQERSDGSGAVGAPDASEDSQTGRDRGHSSAGDFGVQSDAVANGGNASAVLSLQSKLGAANLKIATLQSRLHELRAALEDSRAKALDGDSHQIDRRIVAQLLVTFLSLQRAAGQCTSFGSQQAMDAFSVTASVLGLSQAQKEAVGLYASADGVKPSDGSATSKAVGGFFSLFNSSPSKGKQRGSADDSGDAGGASADAGGSEKEPAKDLGSAFVQFLLSETSDLDV
jgi:myosin heavy subunit